MNRFVSEFIGTFGLVFCGTAAIVANDVSGGAVTNVGIGITFGMIVMAMIYSFGDISGAHINPAVTVAFWLSGRFPGKRVLPYVTAQVSGGLIASLTVLALFPDHETLGLTQPSDTVMQSFVLEVILTFILMLVIIQVSTGSKEVGTLAGLAIGATVMIEAIFAGPICGASMNPARSIGPAVIAGNIEHLWLYVAAPVLGASGAIIICRLTRGKECCSG